MLKVPYHRQKQEGMCGVAALQMIYDYYGNQINQEDIWEFIKELREAGGWYARSYKLCEHAMNLGYPTILARGNINTLRELLLQNIPPIVSQQLTLQNQLGHFRVVLDVNKFTTLHDPQYRESMKYNIDHFDQLWLPGRETTDHVLIAISKREQKLFSTAECPFCGFHYFKWVAGKSIKSYICPNSECEKDILP